jgi:hypothetical protein
MRNGEVVWLEAPGEGVGRGTAMGKVMEFLECDDLISEWSNYYNLLFNLLVVATRFGW